MVKRPNALDEATVDARLMRRFPLFIDMLAAANRRVPKRIAGYLLGGADAEIGLAETCAAFARIRLVPRYGIDVSQRSTAVELFGRTYAAPIGVAPVGYASAIWPGSEQALAAAAQAANVPYVNSTFAIEPLESIKRYAPDVAWFQIYHFQSMDTTLALVKRAQRAGYHVLVLTIDIPTYSKRTRDHRNGLQFPPVLTPALLAEVAMTPLWAVEFLKRRYPLPGNLMPYARDPSGGEAALRELLGTTGVYAMTWDEVRAVRKAWPGKLVIKGIQHVADAEAAVALGADGIIVSNHGGRQFDAAPAPIDSLPAIAEAIGTRATVMMDSGVRSGLDITKALVRGAECCFAGRPFIAACAAAGNQGAAYAMALFQDEITTAFGQLGACGVRDLLRDRTREAT